MSIISETIIPTQIAESSTLMENNSQGEQPTYNYQRTDSLEFNFPLDEDFRDVSTDCTWDTGFGTWKSIVYKDKMEYCQLIGRDFKLIFKVPEYNSEYKRRKSSGRRQEYITELSWNKCYSANLHKYNTRSYHKYTGGIHLEIYSLEWEDLMDISNILTVIFPDLDIYFARETADMNSMNIDIPDLEDYNNRRNGIILEGGVSCITKTLLTGNLYDIMNQIITRNSREQDYEDVSIRLTKKQFKEWIGTKRATKKQVGMSCPICCDVISNGQTISITSCGHTYHSSCLRTWLTKQCTLPNCPTCREDLRK
tara:strand:- start:1376 stop:2305 length:930 start_codon:yes stop_codon:yes gene_type:complete